MILLSTAGTGKGLERVGVAGGRPKCKKIIEFHIKIKDICQCRVKISTRKALTFPDINKLIETRIDYDNHISAAPKTLMKLGAPEAKVPNETRR